MEDNNKWMVCVQCMTYNQAPYIEDAMNGFIIQKTTFPFVCCIIDDASTDGEQEVIDRYIKVHFDLDDTSTVQCEETDDYNLLFARHRTNSNCYFAVLFLKYNHYGNPESKKRKFRYISKWRDNAKYLAICEGDDYWTHPDKLQMQYNFMASHPGHSLCLTHYNDYYSNEKIVKRGFYDEYKEICPKKDIIQYCNSFFGTLTMFYRNIGLRRDENSFINKNYSISDIPLLLKLAVLGDVGYLTENTGNYRRNTTGSWSQRVETSHKRLYYLHREFIRMWSEFDNWTSHKYKEIVSDRIKMERRKRNVEFIKYIAYLLLKVKK